MRVRARLAGGRRTASQVGSRAVTRFVRHAMRDSRFPARRDDGSASVAVRLRSERPGVADMIADALKNWVDERKRQGVDLMLDLRAEPQLVVRSEGLFDVVLDGLPSSSRWKNWMVLLTQFLLSEVPGVTFECFFDLVRGAPHPGSVMSS